MKSWGDLPPARPPRPILIEPTGHGFTRLGITMLVPDLALQGSDLIAVAVLEDPDTGDWFGEDPTYPGSALVAIDQRRVVPQTPDAMAALEEVAAVARQLLADRVAQASDAFARRCHALARQAAAGLPRPTPSDLAVDLGRAARGTISPPATWWRTPDGVRLMAARSEDDPLGWVEEWSSTEDLLVLDGPASREAAEVLVATVALGPAERPAQIDDDVRSAAIEHLARVAPDLAQIVSAPVV